MWNPDCLILTFTYVQALCKVYMEKNSNIISDTAWVAFSWLFHDDTKANYLAEAKRLFFSYEEFIHMVVEIIGAKFLIQFSSSHRKDVRGIVLQYRFPRVILIIIILPLDLKGFSVGQWIRSPGNSVLCQNCFMSNYLCLLFWWSFHDVDSWIWKLSPLLFFINTCGLITFWASWLRHQKWWEENRNPYV